MSAARAELRAARVRYLRACKAGLSGLALFLFEERLRLAAEAYHRRGAREAYAQAGLVWSERQGLYVRV